MVARRFAPSYQGNNEASRVTLRETTAFLQDLKSDIAEAEHELKELCAETNNTWNKVVLIPQNDPRKKFFTC